ncbi:hypothetical protein LIT25_03635 [Bacillus sp. F19]|nr:hypothetical protein LIT25_03635 [Bacillus sp. F19]
MKFRNLDEGLKWFLITKEEVIGTNTFKFVIRTEKESDFWKKTYDGV